MFIALLFDVNILYYRIAYTVRSKNLYLSSSEMLTRRLLFVEKILSLLFCGHLL